MRWQGKSGKKVTGGRLAPARGKRNFENGRDSADTVIGASKSKRIAAMGGNQKFRALKRDVACLSDPVTGQTKKARIETVLANPADINYVRRNIITKGAIIRTEFGEARVQSRPGQDGTVNAVLLPKQ